MIKLARITFFSFFIVCLLLFLAMPEQSSAVSSITVEKNTFPSGFGGFQFSFDGPGTDLDTQFTLADGESQVFSNLDPGTYIVSEINILPEGFDLVFIGSNNPCGTSPIHIDEANATATIELADMCDLGVVFINRANSVISIQKEKIPTDDVQEFDFTSDLPGTENFSITSENGLTILSVPAGTFVFQEELTAGFTLTNIVCDDLGSTTDIVTRTATIDVDPNEEITCTFTNIVVSEIPTLSEWGLIAMAGVLGIIGFLVIRRKKATA